MNVLYCDNHLLVLNKPGGLLTQPNGSQDHSLEELGKQWLKAHFQKKGNVFLEAVHRLDRPASGVVVFARTSKALSRLNAFIRASQCKKKYIALVEGCVEPEERELEHFLFHDTFHAKIVSQTHPKGKRSLLKYRVQKVMKEYTLLEISLITGRYHQIRAQLSAIGHPIVGDQKYASKTISETLFLHHTSISLPHPITQEWHTWEAPLPHYFSSNTGVFK